MWRFRAVLLNWLNEYDKHPDVEMNTNTDLFSNLNIQLSDWSPIPFNLLQSPSITSNGINCKKNLTSAIWLRLVVSSPSLCINIKEKTLPIVAGSSHALSPPRSPSIHVCPRGQSLHLHSHLFRATKRFTLSEHKKEFL